MRNPPRNPQDKILYKAGYAEAMLKGERWCCRCKKFISQSLFGRRGSSFQTMCGTCNTIWQRENRKPRPNPNRIYKPQDPVKAKIRSDTRYAIRLGKLKRLPCVMCGATPSEAHHSDYSKPFDVTWLCNKHHSQIHRKPLPAAPSEKEVSVKDIANRLGDILDKPSEKEDLSK